MTDPKKTYSKIKIKRGGENPVSDFIPDDGQPVYDVENSRLTIGNNIKYDGIDVLKGNRNDAENNTYYGSDKNEKRGFCQYPSTINVSAKELTLSGSANLYYYYNMIPYVNLLTNVFTNIDTNISAISTYGGGGGGDNGPAASEDNNLYCLDYTSIEIPTGKYQLSGNQIYRAYNPEYTIVKKMNGYSREVLASFNSTILNSSSQLTGITKDGDYIYLTDGSKMYKVDWSVDNNPTLIDTCSVSNYRIIDITCDGTNIYSCGYDLSLKKYCIKQHDGFSGTILSNMTDSNYDNFGYPFGITCDSTNIYYLNHVDNIISSFPISDFASPPSGENVSLVVKISHFSKYWGDNLSMPLSFDGLHFYISLPNPCHLRVDNDSAWVCTTFNYALEIGDSEWNNHELRYNSYLWKISKDIGVQQSVLSSLPRFAGDITKSSSSGFYISGLECGNFFKRMGQNPVTTSTPRTKQINIERIERVLLPGDDPRDVWVSVDRREELIVNPSDDPIPDETSGTPTEVDLIELVIGKGECSFFTKYLPEWNPEKDVNIKIDYMCGNSDPKKEALFRTQVWDIDNNSIPDSTNYDNSYEDIIYSEPQAQLNSIVLTNAVIPYTFNNIKPCENIIVKFIRDSTSDSYNGNISIVNIQLYQGIGGSEYGYYCGGDISNTSTITRTSSIDRLHFPFYNSNAIHVGNLSGTILESCGSNSSIYGYVCGGSDSNSGISTINKIKFPFNSGTCSNSGDLLINLHKSSGCNSSTTSYTMGGCNSVYGGTDNITKFDHSMDTVVTNVVCSDLLLANQLSVSCNSSTYGYCIGGLANAYATGPQYIYTEGDEYYHDFDSVKRYYYTNYNTLRTIQRINYSIEGNSVLVGNLSAINYTDDQVGTFGGGSFNSSNYGYCLGGQGLSTIDKIDFSFDSGNSETICALAMNDKDTSGVQATRGCNSSEHGFAMGGHNEAYHLYLSNIDRLEFSFDDVCSNSGGYLSDTQKNRGCGLDGTDFVNMFNW